jgi:hypothetical protein
MFTSVMNHFGNTVVFLDCTGQIYYVLYNEYVVKTT